MTRCFRDPLGCKAYIIERTSGLFRLIIYLPCGTVFREKTYKTFHGARAALERISYGWKEVE